MLILEALLALLLILISAEIFTNGVEVFGEKLSLTQAVVGSILAAFGTALPETIIPLVAILLYKGEAGSHIGIGAILGAPFMLITVGFFLVGVGIFISYLQKRRKFEAFLEPKTLQRDLLFFFISYSLAIIFPLIFPNTRNLHYLIAITLLINYILYLIITFRAESLEVKAYRDLYLEKPFLWVGKRVSPRILPILAFIQVLIAIIVMVKGAHLFVHSLEVLSHKFGFSPLLFALIVAPIATELPEKFNSLLWSLRGKDILALGNMTGAMVFQSTFPVSIGLLFTDWRIEGLALFSALIVLSLGAFYLILLKLFKTLHPLFFFISGLFYVIYIVAVVYSI